MFGDHFETLAAVLRIKHFPKTKSPLSQTSTAFCIVLLWSLIIFDRPRGKVMANGTVAPSVVDCSRPPLNVHPKNCCLMPPLLDDVLLQGCKDIHGPEDLKRGVIHEKGNCYMECAMNATGLLVNGVLDQAKILQLIESRIGSQPAMLQAFRNASMICFQRGPQRIVVPSSGSKSKHCSSTAADFIGCVNMHIFKICLDEYWINSVSCNILRKFIQNCPVPT